MATADPAVLVKLQTKQMQSSHTQSTRRRLRVIQTLSHLLVLLFYLLGRGGQLAQPLLEQLNSVLILGAAIFGLFVQAVQAVAAICFQFSGRQEDKGFTIIVCVCGGSVRKGYRRGAEECVNHKRV